MRARDITGKRVVAVRQARVEALSGTAWDIQAIVFDDGTELRFLVRELLADYAVEGIVVKRAGHAT